MVICKIIHVDILLNPNHNGYAMLTVNMSNLYHENAIFLRIYILDAQYGAYGYEFVNTVSL